MANMYPMTNSPICGPFGIQDHAATNFPNEISSPPTRGMFHKDFSAGWTQFHFRQAVYPVNVARTQTTGHELESCQQVYKQIYIKSERTLVSNVEHLENDIIRRSSPPKYYTEQYSPKDCALTLNSSQEFKMTMPPPQDFTMTAPSPQDFTITAPSPQDCGIGSSSRNFESVTSSPPDYEATYPQFDPCTLDFERSAFSIPSVPPFQGYQPPPADCDSTHQQTTSPKFTDLRVQQQQHYQQMNQQCMRLYQLQQQQQQPQQLQQQYQAKLTMESAAIKSTTPRRKPSASIGKTRTREKYRIVYTTEQKLALEEAFKMNTLVTLEHREWLSKHIQLSERQIKIWFQNRRQKVKRIARKGVSCLSKEYE